MRLTIISTTLVAVACRRAPAAAGPVKVVVTSDAGKLAPAPDLSFKSSSTAELITIEPAQRFQVILGFGAALTDGAAYVIDRMPPAARKAFIQQIFGPAPTGMNMSTVRIAVGASDYSRNAYSYDDGPEDPTLSRFSIDHDRKYILPILLEAKQANPLLFIFSAPWSPPGWMKTTGNLLGGWMRSKYVPVYAQYYLKFLEAYAQAGVKVDALTPQNEPETDQQGRMPACMWHPDDEASFVKILKPLIDKAGLKTVIWLHDHNYDLVLRPLTELKDDGVRASVAGVAFHPYGGSVETLSKFHDAYPDKPIHLTEDGSDLGPQYEKTWVEWTEKISGMLRNWTSSFTAWNLALDEKGTPNIGPFQAGGTVTINSSTHALTYDGQYWAIGHFSRYLQRGAVRVGSSGSIDKVGHIAFVNPDGGTVVVLSNAGPARTVAIKLAKRYVDVPLPANAAVTVSWR